MVDCTKVSTGRDVYFAVVSLHDASVRLSRQAGSNGQSLFVTVHGGGNPTRENILRQFQDQLGLPVVSFQQEVVEGGISITKHIYVWSIINA